MKSEWWEATRAHKVAATWSCSAGTCPVFSPHCWSALWSACCRGSASLEVSWIALSSRYTPPGCTYWQLPALCAQRTYIADPGGWCRQRIAVSTTMIGVISRCISACQCAQCITQHRSPGAHSPQNAKNTHIPTPDSNCSLLVKSLWKVDLEAMYCSLQTSLLSKSPRGIY